MRLLLSVGLLLATGILSAQFADASAKTPARNAKYIVYWDKHQCDLTEGNAFRGELVMSPGVFRQMLLHAPKFWDGSKLVREFSFKLEGRRISTAEYASLIARLDADFGEKASPGKIFKATDLPLASGLKGSIDIRITDPEQKKDVAPARGNWSSNTPYLNTTLLETVVWGRDDLSRISDRDFITVSEFWQMVQIQPYIGWQTWAEPLNLRVGVQFQSPEQGNFGVFGQLDENPEGYRQLLDQLQPYKHLARPGAAVSLSIQTAAQYEDLYRKRLVLVPDGDQRLLLRRSRDTHSLSFYWEHIFTRLDDLYMSTYQTASGATLPVDEPLARVASLSYVDSMAPDMFTEAPYCLVDGRKVDGLSFRVKIGDRFFTVRDTGALHPDIARLLVQEGLDAELDSFRLEGYLLPELSMSIFSVLMNSSLLVRNELETLSKAAGNPARVVLSTPDITDTYIEATFSIPEKATVKISLFNLENGLASTVITEKYQAGQNRIQIPHRTLNPGQYALFLNSPFGVLRQDVEIK
jgi:hypothetical protein